MHETINVYNVHQKYIANTSHSHPVFVTHAKLLYLISVENPSLCFGKSQSKERKKQFIIRL